MNTSQDPFGHNPFGADPFGGSSFGQTPHSGPPGFTTPGPAPQTPANTLATLSLIFAFVFAPAGAILGHLGLSQIARTGQSGRSRAVIGIVMSYSVIVIAVAALVIWHVLDSGGTPATPSASAPAAPAAKPGAAPAPATTAAPAPIVAPSDLAGILPGLEELKTLTADTTLTAGPTYTAPTSLIKGSIARPDCWAAMSSGDPRVYDSTAPRGFLIAPYPAHGFAGGNVRDKLIEVDQMAAAYVDATAAQAALQHVLSAWRACGNAVITVTNDSGAVFPVTVNPPTNAGNGITTATLRWGDTPILPMLMSHAILAKDNVVAEVYLTSTSTDRIPTVDAIANAILAKIHP